MQKDSLDEFIYEILESKKLPIDDEAIKSQLALDLKTRLIDQINRAVVDALPDNKLDELSELSENSTMDEVAMQNFLENSGVDIKNVTVVTMLKFRDLYLQTAEDRKA